MENVQKNNGKLLPGDYIIVICIFLICIFLAFSLSPDYCPDERSRQLLSNWLFERGTLPTGNEPEVAIPIWKFSYALKPYLSAMVGALFMRIAALFSSSDIGMLASSRMCSVLSVSAACYYCLRSGRLLFNNKWSARLFALIVCLLPQVIFLGSYQNNDSLSLFSVSMILYFLISGAANHWRMRECIGLGIAFSICLLSYYSVYGWLLMSLLFCIVSCLKDTAIQKKPSFILKRAGLIFCITVSLAGWFFIRNAILHNGDFLGTETEKISRQALELQGISPYNSCYLAGYTWMDLLTNPLFYKQTVQSFIGKFGFMNIGMPLPIYILYIIFFLFGITLYFIKRHQSKSDFIHKSPSFFLLGGSLINIALFFIQSYYRDYQPQGRYIITVILLLAYIIASGIDNKSETPSVSNKKKLNPGMLLSLIWCVMFACSFATTLIRII